MMDRRRFLAGTLAVFLLPRQGGQADRLRNPVSAGRSRAEVGTLDNDEVVKGIERKLKCTCGCNLDIFTCRTTDFTCQFSPVLHAEVMALRKEGKAPDEVIAAFVAKHGEQILMAPKAEGFNLAGYLVPGVVILGVGAAIAAVIVRRRTEVAVGPSARPPVGPADSQTLRPSDGPTAGDLDRLQRALTEVAD